MSRTISAPMESAMSSQSGSHASSSSLRGIRRPPSLVPKRSGRAASRKGSQTKTALGSAQVGSRAPVPRGQGTPRRYWPFRRAASREGILGRGRGCAVTRGGRGPARPCRSRRWRRRPGGRPRLGTPRARWQRAGLQGWGRASGRRLWLRGGLCRGSGRGSLWR